MYLCEVCGVCSQPGQPRLRHVIKHINTGQIVREVAVCGDCQADLGNGLSMAQIVVKRHHNDPIVPYLRVDPPPPTVSQPVQLRGRTSSNRLNIAPRKEQ